MFQEFYDWLNEMAENSCGEEFYVFKKVVDKWNDSIRDVGADNYELVCLHCDEESIYRERNEKYGNSFHDTWVRFGAVSGLTRMSDKYNRVCQLLMTGSDGNDIERLEDTLMDLSNYANMMIMELRKEKADA